MGVPLMLVSAVPEVGVAVVMLGLVGLGYSLIESAGLTLLQRLSSDDVLGRAFAVVESSYWLTTGSARSRRRGSSRCWAFAAHCWRLAPACRCWPPCAGPGLRPASRAGAAVPLTCLRPAAERVAVRAPPARHRRERRPPAHGDGGAPRRRDRARGRTRRPALRDRRGRVRRDLHARRVSLVPRRRRVRRDRTVAQRPADRHGDGPHERPASMHSTGGRSSPR